MVESLNIALAQINPMVGAIRSNKEKIFEMWHKAHLGKADLVITPEMALSGYPTGDLVLNPSFLDKIEEIVQDLANDTMHGPALILGTPWRIKGNISNCALMLYEGKIKAVSAKHELPNYDVFDEKRLFKSGPLPDPIGFKGISLGVMVCEDMWHPKVAQSLKQGGADLLIVLNASPFTQKKVQKRMEQATARVDETGLPLIYVAQVGGQDELVFDGGSFILNRDLSVATQFSMFHPELGLTKWKKQEETFLCIPGTMSPVLKNLSATYHAITLGLRDYVEKNGFSGIILGLSGGVDSALSAAIAVDALGANRVQTIMMPSPYTSAESLSDAKNCAKLLGIKLTKIAIEPAMTHFEQMLAPIFGKSKSDTTEENIQARIRGVLLMAISNKKGPMVLTTGNKSEMAIGYATLYGDMCGGFSVLKDIYKTDVFSLCRWRNTWDGKSGKMPFYGPKITVIPQRIIDKPPSAELRSNQRDDDSLPPYEILDDILKGLIEREESIKEIQKRGHSVALIETIWRLVDAAEYKRRQASPGVRVTEKAFGQDRRYPITNGFKPPI